MEVEESSGGLTSGVGAAPSRVECFVRFFPEGCVEEAIDGGFVEVGVHSASSGAKRSVGEEKGVREWRGCELARLRQVSAQTCVRGCCTGSNSTRMYVRMRRDTDASTRVPDGASLCLT